MEFTVKSVTHARHKQKAFVELFESDPTAISACGNFLDRNGDYLFAPSHQPVRVLELRNRWMTIRDWQGCVHDVTPTDPMFYIIFH